jgi:molybdopterin converting factor small subunit
MGIGPQRPLGTEAAAKYVLFPNCREDAETKALAYNGHSGSRDAWSHDRWNRPREEILVPKVLVRLPVGVILPGMPSLMECEGTTVADALADCVAKEPRLKKRIFRPDGTPWVGVSVNGRSLAPETGLVAAIEDGDEIRLIPAVGAC